MSIENKIDSLLIEANVVNLDEVDKFIERMVRDRAANAHVTKWIRTTCRKALIRSAEHTPVDPSSPVIKGQKPEWMLKAIERGEQLHAVMIDPMLEDQITHMIDYLNAHFDRQIRMSFDDVVIASDEWEPGTEDKGDDSHMVETFMELPGGYRWVKLVAMASFERESAMMQHCVGQGNSYFNRSKSGDISVYSLRDKGNKAHATAEVNMDRKSIEQLKGKQNKPPKTKYWGHCIKLLEVYDGLSASGKVSGDLQQMGYLSTSNGKVIHISQAGREILDTFSVYTEGPKQVVPDNVSVHDTAEFAVDMKIGRNFSCDVLQVHGQKTVVSFDGNVNVVSELGSRGSASIKAAGTVKADQIRIDSFGRGESLFIDAAKIDAGRVNVHRGNVRLRLKAPEIKVQNTISVTENHAEMVFKNLEARSISITNCTGTIAGGSIKADSIDFLGRNEIFDLDVKSITANVIEANGGVDPDRMLTQILKSSPKLKDGLWLNADDVTLPKVDVDFSFFLGLTKASRLRTSVKTSKNFMLSGRSVTSIDGKISAKGEVDLRETNISAVGTNVQCDVLVVSKHVEVDPRAKIRKIVKR